MKKLSLAKETLQTLSQEEGKDVNAGGGTTYGFCSNQHSICLCPSWSGCTIQVSFGCL